MRRLYGALLIVLFINVQGFCDVFLLFDGAVIHGKIIKRDEDITYILTGNGEETSLENEKVYIRFLNIANYHKYVETLDENNALKIEIDKKQALIDSGSIKVVRKVTDDELSALTSKELLYYNTHFVTKWGVNPHDESDKILFRYNQAKRAKNTILGVANFLSILSFTGHIVTVIAFEAFSYSQFTKYGNSYYPGNGFGWGSLYYSFSLPFTLIQAWILYGVSGVSIYKMRQINTIYEKITGKKLIVKGSVPTVSLGIDPVGKRYEFALSMQM